MQVHSQPVPAKALHATAEAPNAIWRWTTRQAFRFVFLYFVLYNLPFPFGWIPGTEAIAELYTALWHRVVPWVGNHVLHLSHPITVFTNGSGDTTYDYVLVLCYFFLALLGAVLWSWLDQKRTGHQKLHAWFRLGIRMVLAGSLMLFGSVKVFQIQFPEPSLSRLVETYGESSPMGLLWTFMGASRSYSISTGLAEMLAGVLLIFPRLTTLGSLIAIAALTNVFVLNLSYDVPVKLYSLHLLLMAMLLLAPNLRRLANLLVLNRTAEPAVDAPLFEQKSANRIVMVLQLVFGAYILCNSLYQAHAEEKTRRAAPKPPIYGVWSVEEFGRDGAPGNSSSWHRVVVDDRRRFLVQLATT
jgi:uncharacterized membrane protein YphA (DoxX/SURF4 family)